MFVVSATGLYGIFVTATQMTDYDPSLTLSWLQDLWLSSSGLPLGSHKKVMLMMIMMKVSTHYMPGTGLHVLLTWFHRTHTNNSVGSVLLFVCLMEEFSGSWWPRKDADLGLSDFTEDYLIPTLLPKQRNDAVVIYSLEDHLGCRQLCGVDLTGRVWKPGGCPRVLPSVEAASNP